jgi:nucleoside-diphosphate-sugar epimerase
MINVLITCIGSGIGQSAIDSLLLKKDNYRIIGCDGNRNLYATALVDEFVFLPFIEKEVYTKYVLDLCIKHKADVLIPGNDFELELFSKDIEIFNQEGITVIISEPNLIEISRNKQKWHDFFVKHHVNIVPTLSVKEFMVNPDSSILPAIVKPAGGSASQGITIVNSLSDIVGLKEEDIIQPYLFPLESDENYESIISAVKNGQFLQKSEISIQLIFNRNSEFAGIFISKNTLKNGIPVFVDPIHPSEFTHIDEIMKFVPILENHKVKGPVNIQGRITQKGLFFFEMNMRFTGITGNRALLGFNEVDYLVQNFLGHNDTKIEGYAFNKQGVRQVACTTLPRINNNLVNQTITILGAGSTVGQNYLLHVQDKYKFINLLVRETSLEKYKSLFNGKNINLMTLDDDRLQQTLCQTDVFINFASALAFESNEMKFDSIRNVHQVVNKITKAKIPTIINISSQSVYPQSENIEKKESHQINFESTYSFQKLLIEDFFTTINSFSPISKVVSLRLPRIISPNQFKQSGYFGKLIEQYIAGEVINIPYPENNTNLIHVSDVIDVIQFFIEKKNEIDFPTIMNVSGNNTSLKNYCETIQKVVSDATGSFEFSENKDVQTSSMIDGSMLENLGWKSCNDLVSIISDLLINFNEKN